MPVEEVVIVRILDGTREAGSTVGSEEYCGLLAVLWFLVGEPGSVKTATV